MTNITCNSNIQNNKNTTKKHTKSHINTSSKHSYGNTNVTKQQQLHNRSTNITSHIIHEMQQ